MKMRIHTIPKEAISCQLKVLFGMDPRPLIQEWLRLFRGTEKYQGTKEATLYMKALYTQSIQIALHQPVHPIPFRKSSRKGHAKDLRLFISYLEGSLDHKRLALTILRLYTLIYCDPKPDLKTIQEGPSCDWKALQYGDFADFAQKWVKPTKPQGRIQVVPRARSGPNGPSSLLYSHLDAVALTQRPYLLKSLDSLASIIDPSFGSLENWVNKLSSWVRDNGVPTEGFLRCGRLAALAEGGCKTRTIAIGDLFSQTVLLPLHKKLMHRLARLHQDGTMNQAKVIALVEQWSKQGPLFSFDLSSATDRFPRQLTRIVMAALFGEQVAYYWNKVMAEERDFSINKPDLNNIYYVRGQPMGLYSSWPAFAFSHHVFVRYCAHLENRKGFSKYVIIGDDIVIADPVVAERYEKEILALGVSISQAKSIMSYTAPYAAEVCKQLLWNGENVSPIPGELMQAVRNDPLIIPNYLQEVSNRYKPIFSSTPRPWDEFAAMYSRTSDRKRSVKLLTRPLQSVGINQSVNVQDSYRVDGLKPGFTPWDEAQDMNGWDVETFHHYYREVGKHLRKASLTAKLEELVREWDEIYHHPIFFPNSKVPVPVPEKHDDSRCFPFWEARRYVESVFQETMAATFTPAHMGGIYATFNDLLEDLTLSYCCDPKLRDYQSRPRKIARADSRLVLETLRVLRGEIPLPPYNNNFMSLPGSSDEDLLLW